MSLFSFFSINEIVSYDSSASIKNNHSFGSFLVHDPVSTLLTPDGISGFNFVLVMTLSTYVDNTGWFGRTFFVFCYIHANHKLVQSFSIRILN